MLCCVSRINDLLTGHRAFLCRAGLLLCEPNGQRSNACYGRAVQVDCQDPDSELLPSKASIFFDRAVVEMAYIYSENLSYWANSDAKQSSTRGGSKALEIREHEKDTEAGLGRIEPVRLTFDSPAAAQKRLNEQRSASSQEDRNASQEVDGEAPAEELPPDHTPTASVLDSGVQTPDPPKELTGQPGVHLQASALPGCQPNVSAALPDRPTAVLHGTP